MSVRAVLVIAALLAALPAREASGQTLQTGIRLDAFTSIQWNGGTLYLEGESDRTVFTLQNDKVFEVWEGPGVGFLSVWTDKGIGFLWGSEAVVAPHPFGPDAILRATPAHTIIGLRRDTHAFEFVELRADAKARVLFRPDKHKVLDFDVDRQGRIIYLTENNELFTITGPAAMAPVSKVSHGSRHFVRVFTDLNGTTLYAYAPGILGTRDSGAKWTFTPFDEKTQALVRSVLTGKVRIEPRFP